MRFRREGWPSAALAEPENEDTDGVEDEDETQVRAPERAELGRGCITSAVVLRQDRDVEDPGGL